MTLEQRRNRLIKHLERIAAEVQQLLIGDHLFWELQKIVRENDMFRNASGLFTRWIAEGYAQSAVLGVRRQSKLNRGSISLRGFLEEIKEYPDLVSRQHYMSLYAGKDERLMQMGEEDFDRVAGGGSVCIPIPLVEEHISEISASAAGIEKYADRRVAHYDRREPAMPFPTFVELTAAIKALDEIVVLYWRLLIGYQMDTLMPTILFDWQDVFRFPWQPEV
jgi:hypothetical protein